MKTIKLLIIALILFLLFFNGCIVNIIGDGGTDAINRVSTAEPSTTKIVALALLAVYEAVVRIVPSIGDYSVVSWMINLLKKVSDGLNLRK
jgi:hypothetical protein